MTREYIFITMNSNYIQKQTEIRSRVKVTEFNTLTEKIRDMKPVLQEICSSQESYYLQKLMQMTVPIEKVEPDSPENHKPNRSKKLNEELRSDQQKQNAHYCALSFHERLLIEVLSLFPKPDVEPSALQSNNSP